MSHHKDIVVQPTHVFASLSPRVLTAEEKLPENQKRKVEVSGSAELSIPPEIAVLSVILISNKEKAADARASVERRVEYVKQTMINNGLPEEDITVTESLQRSGEKSSYQMETQIDATFCNALQKCMKLSSLFVEKLENSVKVLPPVLKHDPQRLECQRKKACLMAFANARQKAYDLCRMLNQNLGRPIVVTENIVRERKGDEDSSSYDDECNKKDDIQVPPIGIPTVFDEGPIDVQRRLVNNTIHIRVDVTATFELRSKACQK